jgi:hypothetical protein
MITPKVRYIAAFAVAVLAAAPAHGYQEIVDSGSTGKSEKPMSVLQTMVGKWKGSCRTWFKPEVLADESAIEGSIEPILAEKIFRHTYTGAMKGKPRTGEETLAHNSVSKLFEVSWFDSFHMNYGMLFSTGSASDRGFTVTGKYDVGPGQPPWGWKTVYEMVDEDHLTITAYNITADGQESKAVETKYVRVRE